MNRKAETGTEKCQTTVRRQANRPESGEQRSVTN